MENTHSHAVVPERPLVRIHFFSRLLAYVLIGTFAFVALEIEPVLFSVTTAIGVFLLGFQHRFKVNSIDESGAASITEYKAFLGLRYATKDILLPSFRRVFVRSERATWPGYLEICVGDAAEYIVVSKVSCLMPCKLIVNGAAEHIARELNLRYPL